MRSISHFMLNSAIVLLAAAFGPVPPATAQFGGPAGPAEELEIKIYELEHTPVADAAQKLQKLFPDEFDGGERMTTDENTNTLVVRAPAAVHKAIATIMSNLDRADSKRSPAAVSAKAPDAGASDSTSNPIAGTSQKPSSDGDGDFELKIFHLQNALASDTARVIKELYADEFKPGTKLTADERTNSLLIRASAPVMLVLEAIILKLDETESRSPHTPSSIPTDGSRVSNSLNGMAGLMRRNKSLAAKHSPEFQQYEQQAQAAAQAYRNALAAYPEDDARRAKVKADLQGAVHSAFHARQTWQRAQVAEMRKQLDQIEKNISARSQRSNEIIDRRVEDLLNPERQWESDADLNDQDKTAMGQPDSKPSDGANSGEQLGTLGHDVWKKDYAAAAEEARTLQRPLFIWFYAPWSGPDRKLEREIHEAPEAFDFLNRSFVAVKIEIKLPKNAEIQKAFEVKSIPTFVVSNLDGIVIHRWEGYSNGESFLNELKNAMASFAAGRMAKAPKSNGDSAVTPAHESGSDPRKSLLEAENAVVAAKAVINEAAFEVDAAEEDLLRVLEAYKNGSVPEKILRDAQNESKRKTALLKRVQAELQGKERVLALAKEHLAAQIKFAEIELQQAQSQFEQKSRELERTRELLKRQAVPQQEYDTVAAALERARLDVVRATARYEIYSKVLPAPATPEADPTKKAAPPPPASPGEKR